MLRVHLCMDVLELARVAGPWVAVATRGGQHLETRSMSLPRRRAPGRAIAAKRKAVPASK